MVSSKPSLREKLKVVNTLCSHVADGICEKGWASASPPDHFFNASVATEKSAVESITIQDVSSHQAKCFSPRHIKQSQLASSQQCEYTTSFSKSQTAAMWLWYSAKKHTTLQKNHILRCYDLWIYYNLLVGESNALGSMNMLMALQRTGIQNYRPHEQMKRLHSFRRTKVWTENSTKVAFLARKCATNPAPWHNNVQNYTTLWDIYYTRIENNHWNILKLELYSLDSNYLKLSSIMYRYIRYHNQSQSQ